MRIFPESIVPSADGSAGRGRRDIPETQSHVGEDDRSVITRRTFLYGLTLGTLATSLSAEAQQAGKVYRIGHVSPVDFDRPERMEQRSWPAFIQGLRSLGWIEGKNIVFERRPTHDLTSLQQAAAEFVRIKVDVIVRAGPEPRWSRK